MTNKPISLYDETAFQSNFKVGEIKSNLSVIKVSLDTLLEPYRNFDVKDETLVAEAKEIRANLRKVEKVIEDERKRIKKEYSSPLKEFEDEVKSTLEPLRTSVKYIDEQVKMYEEMWRQDRYDELNEFFMGNTNELLKWAKVELKCILDEKWLNKSTSLKKAQDELYDKIGLVNGELQYMELTSSDNDWEFASLVVEYLNNDMNMLKAIERYQEKEKMKDERKTEAPIKEEPKSTKVHYAVSVNSAEQEKSLLEFCERNNIKIERVVL